MKIIANTIRLACVAAIGAQIVACAGPVQRAEQYAVQDEWLKAVVEYRKAYSANPRDIEYRSRLKQMELKAADFYYQKGTTLLEQGNIDAATLQFQQGLAAMTEHTKLQQAMNLALARKEAGALYQEGLRHRESEKFDDAKRAFSDALQISPDHKPARDAYADLQRRMADRDDPERLALASKAPITLNFRQTDLRTAFEFIAKSFGVSVIFDEGVKSAPVTLFAQHVTFEQSLNLLFATSKTFYKRIGPNTILIIPDTKDKRGQYEDHLVRTFQLNTVKAKDMSEILRAILTLKKVVINDELNTLVIRDTEETLKLAERLITSNDRRPAEMILEVEILEVNRSKAERLGLDIGSSVTASIPGSVVISAAQSVSTAIQNSAVLTLPSVTFRFFKQDVDAKTLANPKVRVINGKQAKIHVGDRIPFRTVIKDSLQQERSSYDYKDVGIKLTAEPTIHTDNSATVKLGLEVSSLGENLGTAAEPAFRIGTRNADTVMLLRDGETAILGGLIRDEDRNSRVKVPFLGDIPILGSLFTSYDRADGRTDVLLTITPRVVRGWDAAPTDTRQFYSGTADNYFNHALFANVSAPSKERPRVVAERSTDVVAGATALGPTAAPGIATDAALPPAGAVGAVPNVPDATNAPSAVSTLSPIFKFGAPTYEAVVGQQVEIQLVGENLGQITDMPMEVLFNPNLLNFVRGEAGDVKPQAFKADVDGARGTLKVSLSFAPDAAPTGTRVLARIAMQAVKPGTSYLIYRTPLLRDAQGNAVMAQLRGTRVLLK